MRWTPEYRLFVQTVVSNFSLYQLPTADVSVVESFHRIVQVATKSNEWLEKNWAQHDDDMLTMLAIASWNSPFPSLESAFEHFKKDFAHLWTGKN